MLRLKIMASVIPMAVVALFARGELLAGPRPCIEISGTSVQIATLSWQAGPADYRIFVSSKSFSLLDAAALIVGARGSRHRVEAASL